MRASGHSKRPHLATDVRNQPQRDEAFGFAGLPCFVHKHVREVSDSRAKGVVSRHSGQGLLRGPGPGGPAQKAAPPEDRQQPDSAPKRYVCLQRLRGTREVPEMPHGAQAGVSAPDTLV